MRSVRSSASISGCVCSPTSPGWTARCALLADAFERESGAALVRLFAGADPLFTEVGYRAYAADLLARMTNPYLHDSIERAARDPLRKLGWDDRLVGTIRVCMRGGIDAPRYALGAAAGLAILEPGVLDGSVPVVARPPGVLARRRTGSRGSAAAGRPRRGRA